MKSRILFSGENITNLSSVEFAQSVVKVNIKHNLPKVLNVERGVKQLPYIL